LDKYDFFLSLLSYNRINFKVFDDNQLAKILSYIRLFYKKCNSEQNVYLVLKKIYMKHIPLYKIIYQRRGRIYIPLQTIFYHRFIRYSIGIKHLYIESQKIQGLPQNNIQNQLIILLLDMLSSNKESLLYQPNLNLNIRKEANNRSYHKKIFKAIMYK